MDIHFILHGGNVSKKCDENDQFFQAFTNIEKDEITILCIYWAREKKKWKKVFERDSKLIKKFAGKKKLHLLLINDAKEFDKEIKKADVVYFGGGEVEPLKKEVTKIKKIREKLEDKIVVGSSAGAFLLCQYYVNSLDSQNQSEAFEGLSFLPLGILCHYDVEEKQDEKIALLEKANPSLHIITLDEGEFVNFYY